MQKTPPITCVSEVVLSVADLPGLRNFYTNVLGFPVHSESSMEETEADPEGQPTITFLTICNPETPLSRGGHPQLLVLIDYQRHVYARGRFIGHDRSQSTLNHLAFEIPPESFDDHVQRLEQLGIELSLTKFPAMKARAIFFKDPEDNLLELICHDSKLD